MPESVQRALYPLPHSFLQPLHQLCKIIKIIWETTQALLTEKGKFS